MKYRFTARAATQLEEAVARWRAGHDGSPDLLLDEVLRACEQIRIAPHAGTMYGMHGEQLVRRVLCVKTAYFVYYVIEDDGPWVVDVWSARRRSGPRYQRGQLS